MVSIKINIEEVYQAKEYIKKFDSIKTYDKLDTKTNFIGYLGELKFSQYLSRINIKGFWNTFLKDNYNETDFIINGLTYDIKTTFDDALWGQKAEWDYYILGIIDYNLSKVDFVGFIDKKSLQRLLKSKKYLVERNGRVDYRIPIDKLKPMNQLIFN
jgi:hypothetical protein